jgi:phosphoribulokinase
MSSKHPIIAVTGSSGAGTSTVRQAFSEIFRRNSIKAAFVEGDSFYRYDRDEMQRAIDTSLRAGKPISHFGPEANLFDELEKLFRDYGQTGKGKIRQFIRDEEQAALLGKNEGTFTAWQPLPKGKDLLFYEGNHGGVAASTWARRRSSPAHALPFKDRRNEGKRARNGVDVAQWVDLLIGVVPNVNLEWIQKIHRDCSKTGCTAEHVTAMILRRMPDYINYILPQFSITDINFQRVPLVDTSNPFISRDVPTQDESVVVIHFRDPHKFDFPFLMQKIDSAFMSRPNTMVVPGGKMQHAIEVVCTPTINELMANKTA